MGDNWVIYGLSTQDYKNLAFVNADTLRWIKEASFRLKYYQDNLVEKNDGNIH